MESAFLFLVITTMMICTALKRPSNDKKNVLPDWAFGGFERPQGADPAISPMKNTKFYCPMIQDYVAWGSSDTFNPAATLHDGKIVVLHRTEDKSGVGVGYRISRLEYAASSDGIHFEWEKTPISYPGNGAQERLEWPGGCEDPRIAVAAEGLYMMTYTRWNRHIPRLTIATSCNLKDWTKHDPAFAKAYDDKFFSLGCKSGSILTKAANGKQVIKKIDGRYFMYWGEEHAFIVTSEDLVSWAPYASTDSSLRKLFSPHDGCFDSQLAECGPPAIYIPREIVLLHNGKNGASRSDKRYTANAYAVGRALLDTSDPTRFTTRLDEPFFHPMGSFEKSGQYVDGMVFIKGMVYCKDKWYLYYGCADSEVGMVIYNPRKPVAADPLP